jgi:hypothetical protein
MLKAALEDAAPIRVHRELVHVSLESAHERQALG